MTAPNHTLRRLATSTLRELRRGLPFILVYVAGEVALLRWGVRTWAWLWAAICGLAGVGAVTFGLVMGFRQPAARDAHASGKTDTTRAAGPR
jgi:hypothetical protein